MLVVHRVIFVEYTVHRYITYFYWVHMSILTSDGRRGINRAPVLNHSSFWKTSVSVLKQSEAFKTYLE